MIIKIIAIGAVFYSCLYVSKYLTAGLEKRLDTLDCFYQSTSLFFQMAIKQEKDVLYVLEKLQKTENSVLSNIYNNIYDNIKESPYQKIDDAWIIAVKQNALHRVEKEDGNVIIDFAYILSSLRSVKAESDFERYLTRLYEYIKNERYKTKKKQQLYKKFGIVIGLFFVILMV